MPWMPGGWSRDLSMAAPDRYPTIFVNYPEQHVIENRGCCLDRTRHDAPLAVLERIGGDRCLVYARQPGPVLTIIGLPILRECLWPHLVYPTSRSRWIEHGEILRLTIRPPERPQRIDLVGVADLWGNYERIEDLTGSRWVCRKADDFSQVPKLNLVAECQCKILFQDPNVDRW